MAELGTYHVQIQASAKGLSDQIKEQFAPLDDESKRTGSRMGGFMSRGMVGALAAVGGTAAIGGVFKSGINAARDFETGMNEVFTLLPGISGDAMGDMKSQVKDFAREFGVLPEDAIPALYQSLSAGVPPDNVFAFMEQAQMAAKGGVTDLSTAVDGISSVVNAFGADVIDAAEASDLMFTAVRLGKTDFGQLSASMSNVAPVASALGIGFEDVTAGLAVLTAQGVPTAQATTQMRAAFAELGKSGSVADRAFQDITGQSFPDFIAAGGNVQEAFQLMSDGAEANGSSLIDMFGSIEAGQAVMALTKGDGEAFAGALEEMQNSAGATDAAFEQMNQGMGPAFEKLKANATVALITIGEKLAPFVTAVAEWLPDGMAMASKAAKKWGTKLKELGDKAKPAFDAIKDFVQGPLKAFVTDKTKMTSAIAGLGAVALVAFTGWAVSAGAAAVATIAATWPVLAIAAAIAALAAGFVYAYQRVDWFRNAVDATVTWLKDTAWPAIKVAFGAIKDFAVTAFNAVREVIVSVTGFLRGLWAKWGDDITRIAKTVWNYVSTQIKNVMNIIRGVIKTVTSLIRGDWSGAWDGIKRTAAAAGQYLKTMLSAVWAFLRSAASKALGLLRDAVVWYFGKVRDGAVIAARALRDRVRDAFGQAKDWAVAKALELVDWVKGLPGRLSRAVGNLANLLSSKGSGLISGLWTGAKNKFSEILGWVAGLGSRLRDKLGDLSFKLYTAGRQLLDGLISGIQSKVQSAVDAVTSAIGSVIAGAKIVLGIASPSKVFRQLGEWTGEGYIAGIDRMAGDASNAVGRMVNPKVGVPSYDMATAGGGRNGGTTIEMNNYVQDGRDLNSELRRVQQLVPHIL